MSAITLLSHINIRFIIFSGSYHSPFLSVFSGHKKPRKPHEMRRKRAIILFARTTFAWFTSKDEVTNRLTANADYGVSIVESFTPPKNWLPGQEINKDVYSVNTGNVDAFVKEDIAGVLNYTYETRVTEFGTTGNKYVELNPTTKTAIDGVTTNEAGGFLAWTNAMVVADSVTTYKVGDDTLNATDFETVNLADVLKDTTNDEAKTFTAKVNIGGTDYYAESLADGTNTLYTIAGTGGEARYTASDKSVVVATETTSVRYPTGSVNSRRLDPNGTDTLTEDDRWIPPATGDYIFRRSIKDEGGTTKFTYAGYHYEAPAAGTADIPDTPIDESKEGKYYKIAIGNDEFRADESDTDENGNKQFVFDISVNSDLIGVGADQDGALLADPLVFYVIESEVKNENVDLTFVEGTTDGNTDDDRDYLKVTYSDKQSSDVQVEELRQKYLEAKAAYDAAKAISDQDTAKVTEAEVTYKNAEGEYNLAKKRYLASKADFDYATALAKARNQLVADAKARNNAASDKTAKHTTLDGAWATLVSGVTTIEGDKATMANNDEAYVIGNNTNKGLDDDTSPIAYETIVPENVRTAIGNDGNLTAAQGYLTEISNKWTAIKSKTSQIKTILNDIDDALADGHSDAPSNHLSSADLKTKVTDLNTYLDELESLLQEYYDLFANLQYVAQNATSDTVTDLIVNTALTAKTNINAFKAKVATYNIDTQATAYEDAYDAYKAAYDADTQAASDWAAAITKYNKAVNTTDGAGKTYTTDIAAANAINYVPNQKDITYSSNAKGTGKLNVTWSADTATDEDDASIDTNSSYATYAALNEIALPDATTFVAEFTDPTQSENKNAKKHSELETDYKETTKAVYDEKKTDYENAVAAKNTNAADTAAKETTMNNAYTAWDNGLAATSTISLKVYLDENWDDNWTMDLDTDGTTDVDFYLNKILTAGETSAKLIDGVELDKSVGSKDYKNLTFDLNVGLDSIQVTYDENQRGYTTEAVDNDPNFAGMTATVDAPLTKGSTVTWNDVAGVPNNATPKTYSATATNGTNTKDVTIAKVDSVTIGDKAYTYKIVDGDDVYYGQATTDGAVFKKVADDTAETKEFASPAATFTLTAEATENT